MITNDIGYIIMFKLFNGTVKTGRSLGVAGYGNNADSCKMGSRLSGREYYLLEVYLPAFNS
jgi:hypothetical protein